MAPSVSVVIPSYNHAAYIGEAIASVLAQSHRALEIVITDDGSRDGSPDVIRRIDDPLIDLEVFDRNRGAPAALNSAIQRSRGEYICMLASDDYFLPGKLEKQVEFLENHPHVAAVFGLPRFVDQRGAPLTETFNGDVFLAPFTRNLRTRADWLRHFFYEGNCLCHPASMVRRSAYDRVGLFDPRLANLPDFDMWVRICMEYEISVMPDELSAMRILDGNRNMTAPRRDSNLRALIEYFHVLKHYRALPRDTIRQVFAREIATAGLDDGGEIGVLLAELALRGENPPHKLFALDTMFEAMPESGDHRRLIELTGAIDVFAIEVVRAEPQLREQLGEAHVLAADLRAAAAQMAAAQAETALARDEAVLAQQHAVHVAAVTRRLADRLYAALTATYTEAARLNDELETTQADRARITSALEESADHHAAIVTRSRAYRLTVLFEALRRRIEIIARAVARSLGGG